MRTYCYFGPSRRLDGPPFMTYNAIKRLPGVEAYWYECHGDPALFGKADLHVAVDWAEDALGFEDFVEPRPLVYWMSDTHISDASREHRFTKAQRADRVFCSIWSDPERLAKNGIVARWLPYAAEPLIWHPRPEIQQIHDIGFIGHYGNYPDRLEFLDEMTQAFPNFLLRGGVFFEQAAELLQTAKIVLNHCQADSVNQRVFEVMANGQCLLTPHTSDLEYLGLEDGVHLLTYRTLDEAKAKVHSWLPREDMRREMGAKAAAWVRGGHTYLHRACDLLQIPLPPDLDELLVTPPPVPEKSLPVPIRGFA